MIGENSIFVSIKFNEEFYKIQANKNLGICDIILPGNPIPPKKTYVTLQKDERKKAKELYNAKKAEYDKEIARRNIIRNTILNKFGGQQINDISVLESLTKVLHQIVNIL